ncbi:CoA ester lyase [Alkalilimnicola ehrlichii]|uniref:HpcH/HpaI aldolase/citrate lyase family protein n=1 Tax=Alkalilimnicola ehrlichii TaxID=351052 RepID=UPI001C6DD888|nr:aldolase/citrate lyase family protein [Alkalilimnicola ehrlichii]
MAIKPRRSVLYLPGTNARAQEKAKTLSADGLIFDLEDAVSPLAKDEARACVSHTLTNSGYGHHELIVRVNPLSGPWGHADVKAVAKLDIDALLLPKVESAEEVEQAKEAYLAAGGREDLPLWIMAETRAGY